jgi:hypothetical protein
MSAVTELDIQNHMFDNMKALGNSKKGLKECCSDILNKSNYTNKQWADMTFLAPTTIERMRKLTEAESGAEYRPQADTLERIIKASGGEITFRQVNIQSRYMPKEKE